MKAKTSQQPNGSKKLPSIFYRKVIHTKTGRLLNLTPAIPKDWRLVKIIPEGWAENRIFFTVIKIAGEDNDAQATTAHKHHQQDTPQTR